MNEKTSNLWLRNVRKSYIEPLQIIVGEFGFQKFVYVNNGGYKALNGKMSFEPLSRLKEKVAAINSNITVDWESFFDS
jgi:hypothetical protein